MADSLEELFEDLNFEIDVQPPVRAAAPKPDPRSPFDSRYAEQALAALDQLAPASVMLTENDPVAAVPTRPYDVPVEELFGEVHSSQLTVPVALGELPEEAYPTEVTLTALW